MSEVPKTRRSEYSGASRDLQQQIDELRRKIEEIKAHHASSAWPEGKLVIDDSTYYTDDD